MEIAICATSYKVSPPCCNAMMRDLKEKRIVLDLFDVGDFDTELKDSQPTPAFRIGDDYYLEHCPGCGEKIRLNIGHRPIP